MTATLPRATAMMARIGAATLAVVACAGAMPAWAAPGPATYDVKARVASSCSLGTSPGPKILSTTVASGGKLDPAVGNTTFVLTGLYCAGPSTIKVAATALRINAPQTSLPPAKSQAINFKATASGWTNSPATVTTSETNPLGTSQVYTGTAQAQNNAQVGTITIGFSQFTVVTDKNGNGGNSAKPVDGTYSATVTLLLTPSS